MISRRTISLAGGASLLAGHRLGYAQAGAPMRRVGFLSATSMASAGHILDAFKHGMRDLGWIEGRNVEYRFVFAGGDASRNDALAAELVAQKVDLIMVATPVTALAAKRATKTIPIITINVASLVDSGLVESLARPGGNITGLSSQGEDLTGKMVELLHEVAPRARRFVLLLAVSLRSTYWPDFQKACSTLGLEAIFVEITRLEQFEAAALQLVAERADAVVLIGSTATFTHRVRLFELLQKTRLPVACASPEYVRVGGLFSYGGDYAASARYSAKFVDKIFKGAKPADLPVEQPTKFEMVVNLKTAKALGITIPYSVMLRATEVIE